MKNFLHTLFLVLSALTIYAQPTELLPEQQRALDRYLNRELESQKIPGIALAVVRDGKAIFTKGYGFANLEHKIPVSEKTMFQSGSVGKAFTVMAVLMLADEGKIDLASSIRRYIPEAPEAWQKVTVRHMLEHTSGMTGYPDELDFRKDYTPRELLDLYFRIPLAFEPGARRGYSNVAFSILGTLIERVSGKFYGDFLRERIFEPVGMKDSRIISEEDIVPNRAAGYRKVEGEIKNQEWVAPSHNTDAAGSLYLNLEDMVKFEGAIHAQKLLSPKMYREMWTPITTLEGGIEPWGMSWSVTRENGRQLIAHSGGWQGFTSNFTRYPEKKLAIVLFTNLRGASPDRLAVGILSILAPELGIAGAVPIKSTEPKFDVAVKKLVDDIVAGKIDLTMYSGAALEMMQKHGEKATAEFNSYGKLKRIELIDHEKKPNGNQNVRHRLSFDHKQIILICSFNPEGKVYEMDARRE